MGAEHSKKEGLRIVKTEYDHIYKIMKHYKEQDIDVCVYVGSQEGCQNYIDWNHKKQKK